jgi:hypothetical protein
MGESQARYLGGIAITQAGKNLLERIDSERRAMDTCNGVQSLDVLAHGPKQFICQDKQLLGGLFGVDCNRASDEATRDCVSDIAMSRFSRSTDLQPIDRFGAPRSIT